MMVIKWLKIIGLIFISIMIVFVVVFYRRDLSVERVKSMYLTDHSHLVSLEILSLEGDTLEIDIHYMDMGDSALPVIMLLHGAFSSSHTFIPWAESLVLEGYRVLLMDLPYFGLSDGFEDNITSYRRSTAVVKALLDHLSIDNIHIGGNSLGGAVSWYFASEYPALTNSLLLIDAVPPGLNTRRDDGLLSHPWVAGFVSQLTPRFLLKQILRTAYGDIARLDDETVDRYYDILRKKGTRKSILTTKFEVEHTDQIDRLMRITAPTYLMWGARDTWISSIYTIVFALAIDIPNDNQITVPGVGHLPMEEKPDTVSYYIDFLNRID
jgi:pimeloyl-ACP methyl ester carboxylesterase